MNQDQENTNAQNSAAAAAPVPGSGPTSAPIPAAPPSPGASAAPVPAPASPELKAKRKRVFIWIGIAVAIIAGIAWLLYHLLSGKSESTDDAYTAVEVAQVTPLVPGPVKSVAVVDTQPVHAGDALVYLDDTDAHIAVNQAEAGLAMARSKVKQLLANDTSLASQENLRDAEEHSADADRVRATADLDKAVVDAERRRRLVEGGAVSKQEMTDAETHLREARAAVDLANSKVKVAAAARTAAGGTRQANAALIGEAGIEGNAEVKTAQSKLDQAHLDLQRTVIRSPVDGIVSQRSVDAGQQVQPGTRLMSIAPINQIYVNANFKEGQLAQVKPGQAVKVTSDLYGDDFVYHGTVVGFAGGSGSAFSAIPAQNATGNWIKVVQRLPVRIRLDPKELQDHPLRVGLSMKVKVDLESKPQQRAASN